MHHQTFSMFIHYLDFKLKIRNWDVIFIDLLFSEVYIVLLVEKEDSFKCI